MSNWGDPYQPTAPYQPSAPPARPQPYGDTPDRAFHEAQLDAMHKSADRQARLIRVVLAVVLPVFLLLRAWGGGSDGLIVAAVLVAAVLLGAVLGTAIARRLTARRHAAVVAARPGAEVVEVWGARGLLSALKAAGVASAKGRKSSATSLSMVPSRHGVELWAGRGSSIAVLVAIPWSTVVAVDESRAAITNDGTRPALMLVTAIGQRLLFVPRRHANGGRVAGVPEVRALVGRLEALRLGSLAR